MFVLNGDYKEVQYYLMILIVDYALVIYVKSPVTPLSCGRIVVYLTHHRISIIRVTLPEVLKSIILL